VNDLAHELLSELARPTCRCTVTVPSGTVSFCPATGKTQYHKMPQQPVSCMPCRARKALEQEEEDT